MEKTVAVVGAGFRGIAACFHLLQGGHKVHLIDPSPLPGGLMRSRSVEGFFVDNGVQMFDSVPVALAETVTEIMDGQVVPIDFISSSFMKGAVTDGFSLPDLASQPADIRARITAEVVTLAGRDQNIDPLNKTSLDDLFQARYGRTAADILGRSIRHIYGVSADRLEPQALGQTSFGRLKHLVDAEMLVLKSHPWLDRVLAARRKVMGKIDDFVSIYPGDGRGMLGFCERLPAWLERQDVSLHLGRTVAGLDIGARSIGLRLSDDTHLDTDILVWANTHIGALAQLCGIDTDIQSRVHKSAMLLVTLLTEADQVKNCTYLQNFDDDAYSFRSAAAGDYSRQRREDGLSFITCECPAPVGSPRWEQADSLIDALWQECRDVGMVTAEARRHGQNILRAPVTNQLPVRGFNDRLDDVRRRIAEKTDRLRFPEFHVFNRRDLYLSQADLSDL